MVSSPQFPTPNLSKDPSKNPTQKFSGGRGCLGEGRLGFPGQVWELRFLPSCPSFPQENRSSVHVWKTPGSPRHPLADTRDQPKFVQILVQKSAQKSVQVCHFVLVIVPIGFISARPILKTSTSSLNVFMGPMMAMPHEGRVQFYMCIKEGQIDTKNKPKIPRPGVQ